MLVIIPAYNEEEALPGTLTELQALRPDLDVLVVSDGSRDATADIARAHGAVCVELPFNLGIGGALQTGFRYAVRHDYQRAVQFDADGQHPAEGIATLLDGLDGLDGRDGGRAVNMVIGTRFGEQGAAEYRVGPMRRAAMQVLRVSMNVMTRQRFSDTSSGFRAFDRPLLELFAQQYPTEFMDSTEALLVACNAGFVVREAPVRMRDRQAGTPSTRHFRLVYHYLRVLVTMLSSFSPRRARAARRVAP